MNLMVTAHILSDGTVVFKPTVYSIREIGSRKRIHVRHGELAAERWQQFTAEFDSTLMTFFGPAKAKQSVESGPGTRALVRKSKSLPGRLQQPWETFRKGWAR